MKPRPTIRKSSRKAEALGTFRVTRLAAAHAISVAAMITTPPMVGVPRLMKCAVGPSWGMNWPYCWRTRYRMNSGVVIIAATLIAWAAASLVTRNVPSASAVLLLFLMVGLGFIGILDDYIKTSRQRNFAGRRS